MTLTHSATFAVVRFGLVAALLGAALLIGTARPGSAGELPPPPASAAQDASQSAPAALPTFVGAAGFGWG
jgi:hypothetical protein